MNRKDIDEIICATDADRESVFSGMYISLSAAKSL